MGLNLENVPQILDQLVASHLITAEQKTQVIDAIKANEKGFAGEIAVKKGFLSQSALDAALVDQSALKADAATKDLQLIADAGVTQPVKPFLKANWGNNGVNPASQNPTPVDGASAAANIAQNIVMLANEHPALAKNEKIKEAVAAGAALAKGIAGKAPLDHASLKALQDKLIGGLSEAVTASGATLKDKGGQEIKIDDFIRERSKEISAGGGAAIKRSLEAGVQEISGGFKSLARGDFGSGVAALQEFLASDKGGKHALTVDGQFGANTKNALIAYQREASKRNEAAGFPPIEADGMLGTQTLEAMRRDGFDLAALKNELTQKHPKLMKTMETLDSNREELRAIRQAQQDSGVSGAQHHGDELQGQAGTKAARPPERKSK